MKSIDEIYREMKEEYSRKTGLSINDGGDMAVRLYAVAAQLFSLWAQADYVNRQAFPQTAEGKFLGYHAQLRGLERRGATRARGIIRFEIAEALGEDLTVESGAVCLTAAGAEFITTEKGVIPAGSLFCDVGAEARLPGLSGNIPAGSIVRMAQAPAGIVSCRNLNGFFGGMDEEGDEELRKRVLASYKKLPNGANAAYYETQVLNMDGVAAVMVLPKRRGLGTVDIIISSEEGTPSFELLERVKTQLEAQREICVDIEVSGPELVTVDIALEIKADGEHSFQEAEAAVRSALEEYFSGKLLGKDLLLAKLGNLVYQARGVENYRFSSPSSDLAVSPHQLPVLGSLTVTEMGE
ncbi:MAG TPA: baseplate J/gp47 family protein [Clostridiales bacterium]|nr:baseplate J/gp47 family protein [Clostridiales bacterium]